MPKSNMFAEPHGNLKSKMPQLYALQACAILWLLLRINPDYMPHKLKTLYLKHKFVSLHLLSSFRRNETLLRRLQILVLIWGILILSKFSIEHVLHKKKIDIDMYYRLDAKEGNLWHEDRGFQLNWSYMDCIVIAWKLRTKKWTSKPKIKICWIQFNIMRAVVDSYMSEFVNDASSPQGWIAFGHIPRMDLF